MVLLERHLVGLGGVDADEVGVILVPLPVAEALEEDLDEAEASAAQDRDGSSGPRMRQPAARQRAPARATPARTRTRAPAARHGTVPEHGGG